MKRVIFVGIHNKVGKTPLDSSTRTGKVIDRIMEGLPGFEVIKTNLHDCNFFPKDEGFLINWPGTIFDWQLRAWYFRRTRKDAIVVTLGDYVRDKFTRWSLIDFVSLAHPAGQRSREKQDLYISGAITKILEHGKVG